MKKLFKNRRFRVLFLYLIGCIIIAGCFYINKCVQKGISDRKKEMLTANNTLTIDEESLDAKIEEILTKKESITPETETVTPEEEKEEEIDEDKLEPITVYTSEDVNLRWSPKIKENNVIVTLPKYTELQVFKEVYCSEWYQVCGGEYDELYINKDYILTEDEYVKKVEEESKESDVTNRGGEPVASATYSSNDDIDIYFNVYSYSGYSLDYITNKISETYPNILPIVEQAWLVEQKYGINLRFTLAVACHETGLGKHLSNYNNYFGLKKSSFMSFESPSASVNTFAETIINLSKVYGNTIIELKPIYCPEGDSWSDDVLYFIKRI